MLLNNQWVTEEIKGNPILMGCNKHSSKRKVHSNKTLLQEASKNSNLVEGKKL